MNVYSFTGGAVLESQAIPKETDGTELLILCSAREVNGLRAVFCWDESTVTECTNLDETVRFTSYDKYDFVSLIYAAAEDNLLLQHELNLFFAKKHLVIVMPDLKSRALEHLKNRLQKAAGAAAIRQSPLVHLYFDIFNCLASDFSETLERLEDEIEALSESISAKPQHRQMDDIGQLRKTSYTYKKLLRAMSYIGEQILMDENRLLNAGHAKYFRSIDARLMKLYDFAESLYELSNGLLQIYDSKFSAQMNETVNKLAAITLIFGPLTVIAGIYGMNFADMPELRWRFGYPLSLCVMALVGLVTFWVMKKKKWL